MLPQKMKQESKYILFSKCVNAFCIILFVFAGCYKKQYYSKISVNNGTPVDTIKTVVSPINNDTAKYGHTKNINIDIPEITAKDYYSLAYEELKRMLEGKQSLSFKKAVFITENAWFENNINYNAYNEYISGLTDICRQWNKANKLTDYKFEDSTQVALSGSIFKVMTDTVWDVSGRIISLPFQYDFEDNFAQKRWENMFLIKLMATHKGNCHSLPFLYKILAKELGVKAYLSFAPNHIYIKQKSKKTSWYNTELTNAMFPVDAWIMSSGYVSRESIVSGIYMDTIGEKQSIAVCLNDLAKGYLRKFKSSPDLQFVIRCCDLGLNYFPNYVELLLLKAETTKKQYENHITKYGKEVANKEPYKFKTDALYEEMEKTYATLATLHYKEIPLQMYNEWMASMERDKSIYNNKEINVIFKTQSK